MSKHDYKNRNTIILFAILAIVVILCIAQIIATQYYRLNLGNPGTDGHPISPSELGPNPGTD